MSFDALGRPLKRAPDRGQFAVWFEEGGARLREPGAGRLEAFRKELRLDDIAIEPAHRQVVDQEDRENGVPGAGDGFFAPHPWVSLIGSPKALMAILKARAGAGWWRVLAALSGQQVPYEFSRTGGRARCEGCGQWRHIYHETGKSGLVDWMELDDFFPDALRAAFQEPGGRGEGSPYFSLVVLPRPGGPTTPWYSVKKRRWMEPEGERSWDVCAARGPGIYGEPDGPVVARFESGPPIIAAHVTSEVSFSAMRECGGLLWPSVAVSWQPHLWTSDTYLFFDVRLLERNLGPTATRGTRDKTVLLANTDTWTPGARDLEKNKALAEAELRGDKDMRGTWLYVLGPQVDEDTGSNQGGVPDDAKRLKTWSAVNARLRKLRKLHGDDYVKLGDDEYSKQSERYPYLELKISDRVDINSCPLIVMPATRGIHDRVEDGLRGMGYRGTILRVEKDGPTRYEDQFSDGALADWAEKTGIEPKDSGGLEALDELNRRWAKTVRAVVVALAARDPARWTLTAGLQPARSPRGLSGATAAWRLF